MIVYRVETWEGYGPFHKCRGNVFKEANEAHYNKEPNSYFNWEKTHPTLSNDPIIGPWWKEKYCRNECDDYYFGCESLAHIHHWFFHPGCKSRLMGEGYIIAHYDVHNFHVKKGSTQLVFLRKFATFIGYTELISI